MWEKTNLFLLLQLTRAVLHLLPSESDQGSYIPQTNVDPHIFDVVM